METFVLLFAITAMPVILAGLAIDYLIIRHVCRKEGKTYSIFWPFGSYWHGRIFTLTWFSEAKEAGYLRPKIIVLVAWAFLFISAVVLNVGGFVSSQNPLIR